MGGYSENALGLLREAEGRMLDAVDRTSAHADPGSTALAIDALRLTLLALHEPTEDVEALEEPRWLRVELFGHTVRYGLVRDVVLFGRRWVEVTMPEVTETLNELDTAEMVDADRREPRVFVEQVKTYHPNAVYAVEEVTEEQALRAIHHHHGIRTAAEVATGKYQDDIPF